MLLLLAVPAAGQIQLAPQAGLVLLRNGNILRGQVTKAGDYYIVTVGGSGELRLPVHDVDAVCRDWDDAYAMKMATLSGRGAKPHLDLAEWCLRHDLTNKATEQVVEAMRLEPENPRIAGIERRLQMTVDRPREEPTAKPQGIAVSPERWEQLAQELPAGTVDKFTAVVQPLLMNRCAANSCHGPTSSSSLQLVRPSAGQIIQRRATQRNLATVLQYVNKEQPSESPLLVLPRGAHGGAAALFDKTGRLHEEQLLKWIEQATAHVNPPPVATIAPVAAHLTQTQDTAVKPAVAELPIDKSAPKSGDAPFKPRDPYDPEIFNRRRAAAESSGAKR